MLSAIVGINWGDEGKGRMVDLLSQDYDVVVRYQGGNNAGHTVINHLGKFVLNLMPSGIQSRSISVIPGCIWIRQKNRERKLCLKHSLVR